MDGDNQEKGWTAEDALEALRKRSVSAYRASMRFHAMTQAIVARVLQDHGPIDPERAEREACDIATATAAMVLQMVYEDDAELRNQKAEAERYRQLAEDAIVTHNKPPFFILKDPATSPPRV